MKKLIRTSLLAAGMLSAPLFAAEPVKCSSLSESVTRAVTADPAHVLEVVAEHVSANGACSCEVVKAAILASKADQELVGSIVDVAILEAPESKELISQCAMAVAPDATGSVQKVLAKYDAGQGVSVSAKGGMAKSGLGKGVIAPVEQPQNVLDFPVGPAGVTPNFVGPTLGGPGGYPLLPPGIPPYFPPLVPDVGSTQL